MLGLQEALLLLEAWHQKLPRDLKVIPVGFVQCCFLETVMVPTTGTPPKLPGKSLGPRISSSNDVLNIIPLIKS